MSGSTLGRLRVAVFFAALLTSCVSPASPSATPPLPPSPTEDACGPDQSWRAQLTVSGGFAGIQQMIVLDAGGAMTITDAQSETSRTRVLGPDELSRVRSLLASACPFPNPGPLPSCADCFDYQLEVSYGAGIARAELNDVSLTGSVYEDLIRELVDLGGQT